MIVEVDEPTLAKKLGMTTHVSPLLHKAARLGLDARGLEQLAIARGCDYYQDGSPLSLVPVSEQQLSDEELAIALLNPALRYHPQTIRLGAAMLGAEGNDPVTIARMARMERSEAVVRYVASAGKKYEPANPFWETLVALLPVTPDPKSSVVPHPTRFIAMTGMTRHGIGMVTQWIRPSRSHG
jgi:hypothetical protein